jgi:enoyl-CoA hydratase/carnithine racemase
MCPVYIKRISDYLDVVAQAEDERVLITLGTGPKIMSTGFNLTYWSQHPLNPSYCASLFIQMLGKLVTLPVPTMCLMNGHAYAGGFMFSLCHDYRVIHSAAKICLPELTIGLPVPGAFHTLVEELLPI